MLADAGIDRSLHARVARPTFNCVNSILHCLCVWCPATRGVMLAREPVAETSCPNRPCLAVVADVQARVAIALVIVEQLDVA